MTWKWTCAVRPVDECGKCGRRVPCAAAHLQFWSVRHPYLISTFCLLPALRSPSPLASNNSFLFHIYTYTHYLFVFDKLCCHLRRKQGLTLDLLAHWTVAFQCVCLLKFYAHRRPWLCGRFFHGDTMTCLTQWTSASDLSTECAGTLPKKARCRAARCLNIPRVCGRAFRTSRKARCGNRGSDCLRSWTQAMGMLGGDPFLRSSGWTRWSI